MLLVGAGFRLWRRFHLCRSSGGRFFGFNVPYQVVAGYTAAKSGAADLGQVHTVFPGQTAHRGRGPAGSAGGLRR